MLAFAGPKGAPPPNFAEKTFAYSLKTVKFAKVFFLDSFPLYGILKDTSEIRTPCLSQDT